MFRQSVRLQLSVYYNPDGTLTVCYKETRVRKWTYRRYDHTARETSSGRSRNITLKYIFVSVIVLALFYGFTSIIAPLTTDPPVCSPPTIYTEMKNVMAALKNNIDCLPPSGDLLPNFALKSQGAKVLNWMPSTVDPGQRQTLNWFGFAIQQPSVTPDIVIQGRTRPNPGECWAFKGSQGHLAIALSHRVVISYVSLGSLTKMVSPTGNTWSAPKDFSVYGMREPGQEWTHLGTFLYVKDRIPLQTFELPRHRRAAFSYIKLHISSNWGNLGYTCLHDFRVHGKIAQEDDK